MAPTFSLQVEGTVDDEKSVDEAVAALHESISEAKGVNVSGFNFAVDGRSQLKRALGEEEAPPAATKARTSTGSPAQSAGAAKAASVAREK